MEQIVQNTTLACDKCDLYKTSSIGNFSCVKLMGEKVGNPSIMFVDSTPKEEEIRQKKPFVGLEGATLKKYLGTVGIKDYYCTYLCKCKGIYQKQINAAQINACSEYILKEIEEIKPKVVVPLGGVMLPFFGVSTDKITQARGIPVWNEKLKVWVLPTYNPSYLQNFTDFSKQKKEFQEDLAKALKISNEGMSNKKIEVDYKCASSIAEVEWVANQLLQSEWFSGDTEFTSLDYFRAKLLLNSFSPEAGKGFVIPYLHPEISNVTQWAKEVYPYLKKIWESSIKKIFQFGKIDVQVCKTHGIDIKGYVFDTGLAHSLLDENSPHGLDKIVPVYTDMGNYKDEVTNYIQGKIKILNKGIIQEGTAYWKELGPLNEIIDSVILEAVKKKSTTYKKVGEILRKRVYTGEAFRESNILDCPYEQLVKYAAQDADATFRLFKAFIPLLKQENLLNLQAKIQTPLSYVLAQMEYEGIGGNLGYAKEMANKIGDEMDLAEASILASKQVHSFMQKYQVANNRFNVASSDQISKLLFEEMGLKPVKFNRVTSLQKEKGIKRGTPSTDAESLQLLLDQNKYKVIEDLLKISKIAKSYDYLTDYVKLIENSVDERIHTNYNQARMDTGGGTVTGRLSSKNPNLQNIPSHDPEKAKLIRTVFQAKEGYTFIEADYSQIEFRCLRKGSKVLMADFSQKNIEEVKIGDKILTLEEYPKINKSRRIVEATVTNVLDQGVRECVKYVSNQGELYGTSDHPFLRGNIFYKSGKMTNTKWLPLKDGDFCYTFPLKYIIKNEEEYLKGMVFGLYLTDGSLNQSNNQRYDLSITQVDPEVLDFIYNFLIIRGFNCCKRENNIHIGDRKSIEEFLTWQNIEGVDFSRGLIAGMVLGDGWFSFQDKINPSSSMCMGLSIEHPEVLNIFFETAKKLNNLGYDVSYRVYNLPIKKDLEQKPFYHIHFNKNSLLLFPFLIPGQKQKKYQNRLANSTISLFSFSKVSVSLEEKAQTYDLTTTAGTFICEGFVVHNCWGHASKDVKLLEFLNDPKADIHKKVAARSRKIPEEQVTKAIRDIAKMTVYGLIYGRSTYSIAKEYGMDQYEVDMFVNGFFNLFPQATQYIDDTIKLMETQGYVTNIFGRRRRALNIHSKIKELKAAAQRQARNFPLQSAAADLIYVAMIKLYKALLPYNAKMILQIHDSLVIEIKDEEIATVVPLVVNTMENAVKLLCRTPVDVEIGKNLGAMVSYYDEYLKKGI